jgi:glutaminase
VLDPAVLESAALESVVLESAVQQTVNSHQDSSRPERDIATYIPELGRADPDAFGIAVVTTDGHIFEVGDSRLEFTIQSISKPFVFGLALEEHGRERLMERVGVEPSGNAFNAISVDATNRPFNPMVNAGAIVTTGLLAGADGETRLGRLLDGFAAFAGRRLEVDEAVFASERATGDRNRALGYLMRSFGMVDGDVDETVDLYFRQCSLSADCRDLAIMAATLANRGVNPVTGRRALDEECIESVLSVMGTCGMYDFAGEWAYRVGLPAKSGVAGGVVAVLPGQFGIGVFSPRLDVKGNSVRGIETCRRLASDFSLHPLRFRPEVSAVIRRSYRGDQARSNRVRTRPAQDILSVAGHSIVVYELEGDLHFASMERVFRAVIGELDGVEYVVLDFRRVGAVDGAALEMLVDLQHELDAAGVSLVLAHVDPRSRENAPLGALSALGARCFASVDAALECCEDALLARAGNEVPEPAPVLAVQELLEGLTDLEIAAIDDIAQVELADAGDTIVREGDDGTTVFFLLSGRVSVQVQLEGGRTHRLSTLSPGVAFGELAMLEQSRRSADVVADEHSMLARIAVDDLQKLGDRFPAMTTKIYRNLARNLARRMLAANEQVRALDQ